MAERRAVLTAAAADVAVVILFVVMGRSSHKEGGPWLTESLKVLGPFLIALLLGWLVARAWRTPMAAIPTGMTIWLVTAAAGLLLRRFVFQRSTAMGFVIVGPVFLLVLIGWRLLAEWLRGSRGAPTT